MCYWYKKDTMYLITWLPQGQGKWNFFKVNEFHFESGKIWKRFEQQADVGFFKKSILFAHYIKELSIHLHHLYDVSKTKYP